MSTDTPGGAERGEVGDVPTMKGQRAGLSIHTSQLPKRAHANRVIVGANTEPLLEA